jgi:putative tryptophan/tyrosine transport system substrate-binding protein
MHISRMAGPLVRGTALLAFLGAGAVAPVSVPAPSGPLVAYVGNLDEASDKHYERFLEAVRKRQPRLHSRARFVYVQTIAGNDASLRQAIAEVVRRQPSALVTPTGETALAARQVVRRVPIVFSTYTDPLRAGIVTGMRSRIEPVTGVSLADWLDAKRLEILRDAFPNVRSVAVLADRAWVEGFDVKRRLAAEARRQNLRITILYAETAAEAVAAMSGAGGEAFDAWYVPPTYVGYLAEEQIIRRLKQLGRPAIFATVDEVRDGGLMAYAQDTSFVWPAVAELVSRVIDGEPAQQIPIERPKRFHLAVRSLTAGHEPQIAATVLRRADIVY